MIEQRLTEGSRDPAVVPGVSRAVAWYGVAVLLVVQLFSFIDRHSFSLLIAPIKADFHMSDVQVSLVIGLGFAVAYAIAGLPIGRLVDQWSRPALLSLGLTVWSLLHGLLRLRAIFRSTGPIPVRGRHR